MTARATVAVVFVVACSPAYSSTYAPPPADPEKAAVAIGVAKDPLDAALDELKEACARGQMVGGECAAKARDACGGMTHVARACFDAAEPRAKCEAIQARAIEGARARAIGERAAEAVGDVCESACETRQMGRPFGDVKEALDALCAPAR